MATQIPTICTTLKNRATSTLLSSANNTTMDMEITYMIILNTYPSCNAKGFNI
ncbi:hypothetical protein CE91St65_39030 [[Clostridium] symbiosum]|nr:hypothetical protein CE91St65_39030 [[Clostridium] symbiosum]BDF30928.1 hypothetical protein CE91St66_39050 [[Clostridium] symbiosum]